MKHNIIYILFWLDKWLMVARAVADFGAAATDCLIIRTWSGLSIWWKYE